MLERTRLNTFENVKNELNTLCIKAFTLCLNLHFRYARKSNKTIKMEIN